MAVTADFQGFRQCRQLLHQQRHPFYPASIDSCGISVFKFLSVRTFCYVSGRMLNLSVATISVTLRDSLRRQQGRAESLGHIDTSERVHNVTLVTGASQVFINELHVSLKVLIVYYFVLSCVIQRLELKLGMVGPQMLKVRNKAGL